MQTGEVLQGLPKCQYNLILHDLWNFFNTSIFHLTLHLSLIPCVFVRSFLYAH